MEIVRITIIVLVLTYYQWESEVHSNIELVQEGLRIAAILMISKRDRSVGF